MHPENYPAQDTFTEIGEKYHARVMDQVDKVPTVEWQHGDDPYQSVAVYPSDTARGDILILLHGGGWTNGYKEWMAFCAPALTARGITAASVGYRLAPAHIWPAGFEDVADGVAQIIARAEEFGADPARLFVSGHSAGGHLASMLALKTDWHEKRELPMDVIRGALPISGTYLFGPKSGLSMNPRFLGDREEGQETDASPLTYVRAGAPPFHVAWGENDFLHLCAQGTKFVEALRSVGNSISTQTLIDVDHLGASYASADPEGEWVVAADEFISRM